MSQQPIWTHGHQYGPPPQQYQQPQYGSPQQFGSPPPQPPPQMPYEQPQQQGPPPAQGSLSEFFNQPSVSGGPAWSFKDKPVGTTYIGMVERDVKDSDIQQQTNLTDGRPATYRDGRPKFVMRVPMVVQPDQDFPEGRATWFVQGQARDELVRAMAEAGVTEGPPQQGAVIQVSLTGKKPSRTPGFNPSNQFTVKYQPPEGGAGATPRQATEQPAEAIQPQQGPDAPTQPPQASAPAPSPAPAPPPAASPPPQQAANPQAPPDLSQAQQDLLARLTGGQQQ